MGLLLDTSKHQYSWIIKLVILFLLLFFSTTSIHAEGTKTWQPDPASRSDLYITQPTSTAAGQRSFAGYQSAPNMKMYVHIEDPDNEMVYLGLANSGYSFRIVSPTGAVVHGPFTVNTPNLSSHTLAIAGPDVLSATGYSTTNAMFKFDPQGLPSGDYSIEFASNISMTWFDVTVTSKGATPQEITGRLWSQAWQVNCGSFSSALKAKLYARDEKGYVTQVNFAEAGIKPYVGQFSFNDTGTGNSGNVATDRKSVPNKQSGNPVQKVFLNQPDPNVYPLGIDGEVKNLPLKVDDPANPNITIDVTQSGRVEVVLDFGTIGDYSEAVDRRLFMNVQAGKNTITWDGLRGDGQKVQPRDYPFPVTISYTQGETHFTAYDVEYLDESFVVRTQTTAGLTGPNVLFWDDSLISQAPGLAPNQKVNTDVGSVARQPWSNFNYGNVNTINTWWFSYRDYITSTILVPGDYGDAPNSYGGAVHKIPTNPSVYLGSIAPDEENQVTTTLDGTGDDADGIDDEDAFTTLNNIFTTDTSYDLNVPCVGTAKVAGWIDFDHSGVFDASERAEADCTTGHAALAWANLSNLTPGAIYARLRIASNVADIANPTGGASDGEVEDYPLSIRENSVSGKVTDITGSAMENVTLTIQDTTGNAVNGTDGSPLSATTDATGNYTFTGIPEGDYQIVLTPPNQYAGQNDGDSSADGDVNANISPIDLIIPFSITKTKDDVDNDFVLVSISNHAITQCSAGSVPNYLIEYHLGEPDEGFGFVNEGDVRHFTDVAKINGRQINAILTIDKINSTATLGEQVELSHQNTTNNSLAITVMQGALHSLDNNVKFHIDFIHDDDGSPALYSFAYYGADLDNATNLGKDYLRFYHPEFAETLVNNPTHLVEVSANDYREYRGTADQNGEAEAAVSAFFNQKSSINILLGQRNTEGNADFSIDFERSKFKLPFCHGYDFGDAKGYNTTGINAARHLVTDGLYVGSHVDIDNGAQEDVSASKDDNNGIINSTTKDDENGIKDFPELNDLDTTYSLKVNVTNTTGRSAKLLAWIDVDDNGVFDADEASVVTLVPTNTNASNVQLNWNSIPSDIVAHDSYLRLRFTTDTLSVNDTSGTKSDGEIEDYSLTIKVGGFPVKGRVYNDSNLNGTNDPSEKGVSGLPVVLLDLANHTCVSTKTDGSGHYYFFPVIPGNYQLYEASREKTPSPNHCDITKTKDPAGYRSSTNNVLAQFSVIDAEVNGKDFGDVQAPLFSPNHSGTVLAGNVVFYRHKFMPPSTGSVKFSATNTAPKTTGWSNIIYQDTDCNGKLEGAEAKTAIAANLTTTANTAICLINKVSSPSAALNGEAYINTITALFDFNGNALAGNTTLKVTDITKATANTPVTPTNPTGGNAKLILRKTVQNITQNGSETETQNQAKPNDVLKYRIYYSNVGNAPLTDLIINDSVPDFTTIVGSPVCETPLPSSLTNCTGSVNAEELVWTFPARDKLKAGAKGVVSYEVKIDQGEKRKKRGRLNKMYYYTQK